MHQQTKVNLKNLLLLLSEVADIANPNIARHQQRTVLIATEIAKYSNKDRVIIQDVFSAALLHDIGALSVG
jgi:HD-GYP domain-containing protein (c-di-GMP phosphodiesterase class II)